MSRDWRTVPESDYLEKADTEYLDFVSCHIKVHGEEDDLQTDNTMVVDSLKDSRRPWTRRFKDYLEVLQPQSGEGQETKFPFYFYEVDNRGEITIGMFLFI